MGCSLKSGLMPPWMFPDDFISLFLLPFSWSLLNSRPTSFLVNILILTTIYISKHSMIHDISFFEKTSPFQ